MTDLATTNRATMDPMLREVRIRATRLMKAARRGEADALARLGGHLKHRHALNVAAQDVAGICYPDLLAHRGHGGGADPARFFDRCLSPHWNHWFARYPEARAHLDEAGGFLFPFKSQFVVVDRHVLDTLGLDPDDTDWAAIGFDWVRPADIEAFNRLSDALCAAGYGSKPAA